MIRCLTCHVICALCAVQGCCPELLCGGSFCSCWGTLSASTGDTGSRPLTLLS